MLCRCPAVWSTLRLPPFLPSSLPSSLPLTGILKYVDVQALLQAMVPTPLPEGGASTQVTRPLLP